MKQNTKFGLLLLGASVIGSATTLFATSALSDGNGLAFSSNNASALSGY